MSSITVCKRCNTAKPDDAFPCTRGKRVGRVCKGCYGEARRHKASHTPTARALRQEALRSWACGTCGRIYPDVFPNTMSNRIPISVAECRGCAVRERARRRKA